MKPGVRVRLVLYPDEVGTIAYTRAMTDEEKQKQQALGEVVYQILGIDWDFGTPKRTECPAYRLEEIKEEASDARSTEVP